MINENKPVHIQQSRTIHRDYSQGEVPKLVPSKFSRFSVFLDVTYDEEHAELISDLHKSIIEVLKVVEQNDAPQQLSQVAGA
jgi:hypothetical protein